MLIHVINIIKKTNFIKEKKYITLILTLEKKDTYSIKLHVLYLREASLSRRAVIFKHVYTNTYTDRRTSYLLYIRMIL